MENIRDLLGFGHKGEESTIYEIVCDELIKNNNIEAL
jgi:hypothetical protein